MPLEVARLRAGGAIVLGKTADDDFAYSLPSGQAMGKL